MRMRFGVAAVLAAVMGLGCASQRAGDGPRGRVDVRVDALASGSEVTRVEVEVQPAGVKQDLVYDSWTRTFSGKVVVASGSQSVTGRAFAGTRLVGIGSADVVVVGGETASVYLHILDVTGPEALPDHAPIIASLVAQRTMVVTGEPVALAAVARDPDGDPVTFAWTQTCEGTFSAPTQVVTEWTSAAPGACELTLTASAKGLVDVATVRVLVLEASSGSLVVDGRYVPNPRIASISASSRSFDASKSRWDSDVFLGAAVPGDTVSFNVSFDLFTATPGELFVMLESDCGGHVTQVSVSQWDASFRWSVPAQPTLCFLTATVVHEGLVDHLPVAVAVEACSSDAQCAPGLACIAGACTPPETVTGSRLVTYWTDAGLVTLPDPDLFTVEIAALVTDASGTARYPATAQPDGTFQIPGVPPGRYQLELLDPSLGTRILVETSARALDLGRDEIGRADKAYATMPTEVTFDVAGLDPWTTDDQLQATASGGVWDVPSTGWEVPEGATAFVGAMDWWETLLDAGAGDQLYLHQLSAAPDAANPGVLYRRATRAALVPGVAMADGVAQTIAATLEPVPQTGLLDVPWVTTGFEARLAEVSPRAVSLGHSLLVEAAQGALGYGGPQGVYGWPDLLLVTAPPGTPDFAARSAYGQFLPAGWSEFRNVVFQAAVPFTAPAASSPRDLVASIFTQQPLPAAGPLAPAVTPVRAPRLDGADAFTAAAGVGPTPVLSWDAPAQGEPTSYLVLLYRLDLGAGGTTRLRRVASLHTTQASIRIPWGVLEYGSTYTARISALRVPGAQLETAPFRSSYDYARADAVTGTFSP